MKNILYMSLVDWFWIKQRPHHFAELLSRENKVTYLSRRRWKSDKNSVFVHSESDVNLNSKSFKVNENMTVIRQRLIPRDSKLSMIRSLNSSIMKDIVAKQEKTDAFDVVLITHPSQVDYIPDGFLETKTIIYDCMDNYSEFSGFDKDMLLENERSLIERCSFIIVSSMDLRRILINRYKSHTSLQDKIHIINNGVDIDNFSFSNPNLNDNVEFLGNERKKVGYIGSVTHWLDMELLEEIARMKQDIDFFLVGPVGDELDITRYKDIKNIIFSGTQPYYKVPAILNKLDVAIMPFIKSDLIKSVNPVKIYEYLALGKPVIAVRYEETSQIGDLIYTYDTKEEFTRALDLALNEKDIINWDRIKFAEDNTWKKRVNTLLEIIK